MGELVLQEAQLRRLPIWAMAIGCSKFELDVKWRILIKKTCIQSIFFCKLSPNLSRLYCNFGSLFKADSWIYSL